MPWLSKLLLSIKLLFMVPICAGPPLPTESSVFIWPYYTGRLPPERAGEYYVVKWGWSLCPPITICCYYCSCCITGSPIICWCGLATWPITWSYQRNYAKIYILRSKVAIAIGCVLKNLIQTTRSRSVWIYKLLNWGKNTIIGRKLTRFSCYYYYEKCCAEIC